MIKRIGFSTLKGLCLLLADIAVGVAFSWLPNVLGLAIVLLKIAVCLTLSFLFFRFCLPKNKTETVSAAITYEVAGIALFACFLAFAQQIIQSPYVASRLLQSFFFFVIPNLIVFPIRILQRLSK